MNYKLIILQKNSNTDKNDIIENSYFFITYYGRTHDCTKKKYIQDFRCLAEKCPDHCCQGWNIPLQVVDVHNLHGAGFGNIVDVKTEKGSTQKICQITLKNRQCGAISNGLCRVQEQSGHDALPLVCASYPRAFYKFSSKENPLEASKLHHDVHGFYPVQK